MKQLYQGDVGLVKLDKEPSSVIFQKMTGEIVVALGEKTGHSHRLQVIDRAADVEFGKDSLGNYVINVKSGAVQLIHNKHGVQTTREMGIGFYVLPTQFEYDELEKLRRVQD